MIRPLTALLAVPVLALAVSACGSAHARTTRTPASTSAATTTSTGAAGPAAGPCRAVAAQGPIRRRASRPTSVLSATGPRVVTLHTSCGAIIITLDVRRHPRTASSFASLVRRGFYDGLGFVRVVPGFVIQGGDPDGDGSGGPGYQVVEAPGNNAAYRRGIVAMAKTGADPVGASGSQFFIVTGADAALPPEYAIAGRVSGGLDVAETIGAIPPEGGSDGPPTRPVIIEKATLGAR